MPLRVGSGGTLAKPISENKSCPGDDSEGCGAAARTCNAADECDTCQANVGLGVTPLAAASKASEKWTVSFLLGVIRDMRSPLLIGG